MTERIYNLVGNGESATLSEFQEEPFDEEDALQELIAGNPELLAGEQMNPGDPPRWILITREAGIPDQPDGSARWSLDHALIDQHAVPTLVETKRGNNTEIRRTIVGQMLDYAANASKHWNVDQLREKFDEQEDTDLKLSKLLDEEEPNHDEFWNRVDTNLRAKNLRLLFVADRIPDELATVVEFLNEQMPRIEVLAVEIKQFRGDSGRILVPRVIGRPTAPTQRRSASRRRLTSESFLESFPSSFGREAAQHCFRSPTSLEHGSITEIRRLRSACTVISGPTGNPSPLLGYIRCLTSLVGTTFATSRSVGPAATTRLIPIHLSSIGSTNGLRSLATSLTPAGLQTPIWMPGG